MLGVDPGTRRTGYAVLITKNGNLVCQAIDAILLPEKWTLARRLGRLGLEMQRLIEKYSPDEVSVEQAIYAQNVRTALALGQARGVILFTCVSSGREVFEYSPREVKRAVTGNGNASKLQVQGMVRRLLGLPRDPLSDEADAAALALCHLMRPRMLGKVATKKGLTTASPRKRKSSQWTLADIQRLQSDGRSQ